MGLLLTRGRGGALTAYSAPHRNKFFIYVSNKFLGYISWNKNTIDIYGEQTVYKSKKLI